MQPADSPREEIEYNVWGFTAPDLRPNTQSNPSLQQFVAPETLEERP